jgi:hypothetical protein
MTAHAAQKIDNPIQHIKKECDFRWETILRQLAPDLVPVIDKAGKHALNPRTNNPVGMRTLPTFSSDGATYVSEGSGFGNADGIETLAYYLNSKKQAISTLMSYLREGQVSPSHVARNKSEIAKKKAEQTAKDERERVRIKQNLVDLANRCLDINADDAVVPVYFLRRGLEILTAPNFPSDIYFVKDLKYYHEDQNGDVTEGYFPAMVAAVRNYKGEIVSFHRTYLDVSGKKADVPEAKKLTESNYSISGAGIRLYQPNKVLGLSEGIETALAVHAATGMPMWSTITANGLESIIIPEGVSHIAIWADFDKSGTGQTSAIRLQERLVQSGYSVSIFLPKGRVPEEKKSVDWLDVLNEKGIKEFPCVKKLMSVDSL